MGNCRLPREFAKQNARNYLLKAGAIDRYNNIIDEVALSKTRATFRQYAMSEYNLDVPLILNEDVIGSSKVVFNQSAFRAIDILRGKVSESDFRDAQTQGYLNIARRGQETLFDPVHNDTFFNEMSVPIDEEQNAPLEGVTALVTLKQRLLNRAKDRLAKIKPQLRDNKNNEVETKRLLKLQAQIKDYIEGDPNKNIQGLENEIEELEKVDTRAPEILAPYINKEIRRLADLVQSDDPALMSEAREIVRFVKAMGDFNSRTHPFYHYSELWDKDSNFLLTESMVQPYLDWKTEAEYYEGKLNAQNVNMIETVVNNNDKIQKMYPERFSEERPFTYEELTAARKDTSWVDSMIMDISAGITSTNGILPQVIRNTVDNSFETQYAWAKGIQEKITHQTPAVQEELKKLGYSLTNFGFLGINGVSYDLFKQMIPNTGGQSTGNIVEKYSVKWFEDQSEMKERFKQERQQAKDVDDPVVKRQLFDKAIQNRNAWYANNTQIVNPAMLSAIANDPELAGLADHFTASPTEIAEHKALLESIVGKTHMKVIVASQREKLKSYLAQKEIALEEIMAQDGATSTGEMSTRAQLNFQAWDAEKNPFMGVAYRANPVGHRVGNINYHSQFNFNESVPLANKEFYDENFAKIEANPVLHEFYETIHDATSGMRQRFPHEVQEKMLANSVPHLKQSVMEILTDKNLTAYQALSKIFRQLIDSIKSLMGIRQEQQVSYADIDPTTGIPSYKVNANFIKQNQNRINDLFTIKKNAFAKTYQLGRLTRFSSISIQNISDTIAADLSKNYMGKAFTKAELQAQFGDSIPVGKIIHRAAQHEVAQEKSFDLPKVIKLYTHLAAAYVAREEMLPLVEIMKDHYQQVGKVATNNMGQAITNAQTKLQRLDGLRTHGILQSEDWFRRVVIGDMGLSKHYKTFGSKLYTKEEQDQIDEIDKILGITKENPEGNYAALPQDEVTKLLKIKADLGKDKSLSAIVDSVMAFIRFKGLGFNLSSGVTNFMAGQVANSVQASAGNYFPPDFIYTLSVSDMVAGDLIKQFNPAGQPEPTAKAEYLAKATDVLQDNTNELQKASTKSAFSRLRRLNPYYVSAKTEQYNQMPLMVATLRNTPITGIDGTVGNVWEALEGVYDPASKEWSTKLSPNFATEENKKSWEHFNGADYLSWKSTIKQVIANTHGDFSDTGGMRAKSHQAGKAMLMFKSWLPREFYKIWAVEQDDVLSGVKGFKGRWRSMTPVTAAMQGAVMGTYAFSWPGAIGGAVAGLTLQYVLGGSKTNISLLSELALTTKLLARKMMGMPVNLVGSMLPGVHGRIMDTQLNDSHFAAMQSRTFSKVDFNNFRANIQHMSTMLSFMGLLLITKAIAWDDDDDQDSMRRKMHNLLANRFMQMASEGMMYASLNDMSKTVMPAIVTFTEQLGKLSIDFLHLMEGEDTTQTGVNAGESKFLNQAKKTLLPGLIAHPVSAGFGVQTERQFNPTPFDSWFFGEEKEAKGDIKKKKAERKRELSDGGATEDEIKETLKREFPRKAKGQTFVEQLELIDSLDPDNEEEN